MNTENKEDIFYKTIKDKISKKLTLTKEELDYHHDQIKKENLFAEELQQKSIQTRFSLKKEIENKYANWILNKDIYPYTIWFLKPSEINLHDHKKNEKFIIEIGDYIEFIDPSRSFDQKDEYVGSINTQVRSFNNECIYLALNNNEQFLMGEGSKIIRFKKFNTTQQQKISKKWFRYLPLIFGIAFVVPLILIIIFMT